MNRKRASGSLAVADAEEGIAVAVFSRFGGPPDHDGDITEPTAFTDGKTVPVSPWNHTSIISGDLPAGLGTIRVLSDRAECVVRFFLDTHAGLETYRTLKALGGSQWSYGYEIVRSRPDTWNGRPCRVLEEVDIIEVSPVLRAAGRGTATIEMRSSAEDALIAEALGHLRGRQSQERDLVQHIYATHFGG